MHILTEEYGVPMQHSQNYVYRIVAEVGGKRLHAELGVPSCLMHSGRDRAGLHAAQKKQVQDLLMREIQKVLFT